MKTFKKMPLPYEPKRNNRWLITFPADLGIQQWWLASASRPSYQIKRYSVFGKTLWTKHVYDDLVLVIRDLIGPSASDVIYKMIEIDKPIDIILEMLDPTGVVIEKWLISNCRINKVNFGGLSYDDDSITNITLTLSVGGVKLGLY